MRRILLLLALMGLLVAACDSASTEDAIREAAEQVEQVAEEVADNAGEIAEQAEEVVEEVVEQAEEVVEEASEAMSSGDLPEKVTVAYFLEWPTPNQVAQLEKNL